LAEADPWPSENPNFPRKGSKNFTQYISERPEMVLNDEGSMKAKTIKEKFKIMNKPKIKQQLRRGFFALAIVGALLTLPKAQAQPVPASGSTTDCEHVISQQIVGSNTITILEITTCSHGTLEGTWVGTERDVFRADGTGTAQASGFFSGTVNGRSGTMVFSYHVTISLNGAVSHWVLNQGTGDLAGLHGQGIASPVVEHGPGCPVSGFDCTDCPPATGTCDDSFDVNYTGQIDFAP
jgi:hypothetical protein